MTPLLSAQFDFQGVVIILALIFSFLKWVWENWQEKRASAQSQAPKDPTEQRLREVAWRKQTRQSAPPPIPTTPPPPSTPPSAWNELRKAWQDMQEVSQPPPKSTRPPKVPLQRSQAARTQPAVPASPAVPVAVAAPPVVMQSKASLPPATSSFLATLQHLRRDPALMRQAILMQEILGPPKALQSSRDFAI